MTELSCRYSFDDLHEAAFGQKMTEDERRELYALTQAERNRRVGEWAEKAQWQIEDRIGADGVEYRAFWTNS